MIIIKTDVLPTAHIQERAEIFLMFINKICGVYSRLTDKSLAVELAEIVKNLRDIEE